MATTTTTIDIGAVRRRIAAEYRSRARRGRPEPTAVQLCRATGADLPTTIGARDAMAAAGELPGLSPRRAGERGGRPRSPDLRRRVRDYVRGRVAAGTWAGHCRAARDLRTNYQGYKHAFDGLLEAGEVPDPGPAPTARGRARRPLGARGDAGRRAEARAYVLARVAAGTWPGYYRGSRDVRMDYPAFRALCLELVEAGVVPEPPAPARRPATARPPAPPVDPGTIEAAIRAIDDEREAAGLPRLAAKDVMREVRRRGVSAASEVLGAAAHRARGTSPRKSPHRAGAGVAPRRRRPRGKATIRDEIRGAMARERARSGWDVRAWWGSLATAGGAI